MPHDFPDKMRPNDMEGHSTPTRMLCLKWMGKKAIYMLPIFYRSTMVQIDRENRDGDLVKKPQVVINYNEGMKGVDKGDQMASYYPAVHCSLKRYKKVFMYLFDLSITNAFLIYKLVEGNITQQLHFREEVVRGLLYEYLPDAPRYSGRGQPVITNTALRLQGRYPHILQENPGKKYKRCHVCYTHGSTK